MTRKRKKGQGGGMTRPAEVKPAGTTYPGEGNLRAMTVQGVPEEQITECAAKYTDVVISVRRRNAKGQLASLGYSGWRVKPNELLTIDQKLRLLAGGGEYVIDARDPHNPQERVIPIFAVHVEGAPTVPRPLEQPVSAGGHLSHLAAPVPQQMFSSYDTPRVPGAERSVDMSQPWVQGLPVEMRAPYVASATEAPRSTIPSDQLAVHQMQQREAENAALRAQLQAMQERFEARMQILEKERRESEMRHMQEMHRVQLEAMQRQIAQASQTPAQKMQLTDIAALVSALAPILTAVVMSGKDTQTKSMEMQQQLLTTALSAATAKPTLPPPTDPLEQLGKLLPVLQAMNPPRDASGSVAMLEAMTQSQMQMIGMGAQLLESVASQQAGDTDPPWLRMVEKVTETLKAVGAAYQMEQMQQMQQMQRAQQLRAQQQPAALGSGAPAVTQIRQPVPVTMASTPGYQTIDAPPAGPQPMHLTPAMLDATLPKEYQTPEWKQIVVAVHRFADIPPLATFIAKYIGQLDATNALPEQLAHFEQEPVQVILQLLSMMPVFTVNRPYCDALAEAVVQAMFAEGVLEQGDEENEDAPEQVPSEEPTDDSDDAEPTGEANGAVSTGDSTH